MKQKDFRCLGKNKKGKDCNHLFFRYIIKTDEIVIQAKCPSCNTFQTLILPLNQHKHDN